MDLEARGRSISGIAVAWENWSVGLQVRLVVRRPRVPHLRVAAEEAGWDLPSLPTPRPLTENSFCILVSSCEEGSHQPRRLNPLTLTGGRLVTRQGQSRGRGGTRGHWFSWEGRKPGPVDFT